MNVPLASQEKKMKLNVQQWSSKFDEIVRISNRCATEMDALESKKANGDQISSDQKSYGQEVGGYLCEYLGLEIPTDGSAWTVLDEEEKKLRGKCDKLREESAQLKQESADLSNQINEAKSKYRQLLDEKSAIEKSELFSLFDPFARWAEFLGATYKTDPERDNRCFAVNVQLNDVIRRILIEDPNKTPEEKFKEFWRTMRIMGTRN
ncbi:uncharacterized protein LOC141853153 [Brevipalpus obovatus]|uniref:uncharacterized protein LOC141853153 n=1 Tax=Brevipalpus obovatus TaxID=246614 RepID=UPI003D9DC9B6